MASGELRTMSRESWGPANPWLWVVGGLGLCATAWLMVLGEVIDEVRVSLLFLGLVACGVGITIRLNFSQQSVKLPPVMQLGLIVLFASLAVVTTTLYLCGLLGWDLVSWRAGQLFFLWLLATPLSITALSVYATRLKNDSALTRGEETAALLVLAGLSAFCGCWALLDPEDPGAWDSMRLFLGILTLVCLVAAPLVMAPPYLQRLFISLMVVIHFGGILTASLSAPPAPWIIGQVWSRLYRPYLEFMYLNNAYHFYAPEPGPASHLWFRLFHEAPDGQMYGTWYKIPDVDDKGRHSNTVALEYQRVLALTENTVPSEATPNTVEPDAAGQPVPARWLARRLEHSPQPAGPIIPGQPPERKLKIPFHPDLKPEITQYSRPTAQSRSLLQAYARKVCRMPHPTHKNWKIKSVKIYRVQHIIPPIASFARGFGNEGMDATDPVFYRPYFMGEFDPQGELMDPYEPFLYWHLPVLRYTDDNQPIHKYSNVKNYALLHAGDPAWIFAYSLKENRWLPLEP